MKKAYKKILCERKGPNKEVLWITFNDEKMMNALSDTMQQEFLDVLEDIAYDNTIRCVVLKGAGDKAFSSGGDIKLFQNLNIVSGYDFAYNRGNSIQHLINTMEKPLIAAVNGYCFAGGMELALSCDFIYASENSKFGLLEINIGLLAGWGGSLPGGLSIATIIGGSGFGAVCGASVASSAVLGKLCIPEMRKLGYSDSLSTGSVAACANLASMIPPSGLMIVYSIFTEQSLGSLFIAGILPGVLLAFLFSAMIYIRVSLNPEIAPRAPSVRWGQRLASLRYSWGILLIGVIVLGGIYSGIFTVTEAGGAGAFVAFFLVLITGSLSWKNLKKVLLNALKTTVIYPWENTLDANTECHTSGCAIFV